MITSIETTQGIKYIKLKQICSHRNTNTPAGSVWCKKHKCWCCGKVCSFKTKTSIRSITKEMKGN